LNHPCIAAMHAIEEQDNFILLNFDICFPSAILQVQFSIVVRMAFIKSDAVLNYS
jgi:hypothetical protein